MKREKDFLMLTITMLYCRRVLLAGAETDFMIVCDNFCSFLPARFTFHLSLFTYNL